MEFIFEQVAFRCYLKSYLINDYVPYLTSSQPSHPRGRDDLGIWLLFFHFGHSWVNWFAIARVGLTVKNGTIANVLSTLDQRPPSVLGWVSWRVSAHSFTILFSISLCRVPLPKQESKSPILVPHTKQDFSFPNLSEKMESIILYWLVSETLNEICVPCSDIGGVEGEVWECPGKGGLLML